MPSTSTDPTSAQTTTALHHDAVSRLLSASSLPSLAASHSRSFARCIRSLASPQPSSVSKSFPPHRSGLWGSVPDPDPPTSSSSSSVSATPNFDDSLPLHFAIHNPRCRRCGVVVLPGINSTLTSWRRRGKQKRACWGWQCRVCGDRRATEGTGDSLRYREASKRQSREIMRDETMMVAPENVSRQGNSSTLKRERDPSSMAKGDEGGATETPAKRNAIDPLEARRQALREAKRAAKGGSGGIGSTSVIESPPSAAAAAAATKMDAAIPASQSLASPNSQQSRSPPTPISSQAMQDNVTSPSSTIHLHPTSSSSSLPSQPETTHQRSTEHEHVPPKKGLPTSIQGDLLHPASNPTPPASASNQASVPSNRKRPKEKAGMKAGLQALLEKDRQRKATGSKDESGGAGAKKPRGLLAGFLDSL